MTPPTLRIQQLKPQVHKRVVTQVASLSKDIEAVGAARLKGKGTGDCSYVDSSGATVTEASEVMCLRSRQVASRRLVIDRWWGCGEEEFKKIVGNQLWASG